MCQPFEAAPQVFRDKLGDDNVGILAAGALVIANGPLSQFADRVAEKAVPMPKAREGSRKERAYRDALALALRDRELTPAEELALARLAEELGIGAGRALEIRQAHESGGEQ